MAVAVMSPFMGTPVGPGSGQSTPTNFVSPSTRRQIGATVTSPAHFLGTTKEAEKERRERRRSIVLELQRRKLGSPGTPDGLQTTPLGGLTSNQLSDHYSNCIKLSAENKINSKNAFGLHLIDYMTELLKRKELENFQVASSTLDASTKIYAGRVDAVYAETYKVLTGLDRGSEKQEDEQLEGDVPPGEEGEGHQKKKKKARNCKTVETNLKNINMNNLDMGFEVDPLQEMTTSCGDGGASGLLTNQLCYVDDESAVLFDCSTVRIGAESASNPEKRKNLLVLSEIKDICRGVDLQELQTSEASSQFKFTDWDQNDQDFLGSKLGSSGHAFDLNAEPEPLAEETEVEGGFMGEENFPEGGDPELSDTEEICGDGNFNVRQTKEHIFTKDGPEGSILANTLDSIRSGTASSLIQVLAAEPSDYSYFNTSLLHTWAGPSHWKVRQGFREAAISNCTEKAQRKKKPPFKLNYDEEVDFQKEFKQSKAKTLTKATLKKYESLSLTLPTDLHYDFDKLLKIFIKPKIMVKRKSTTAESIDDGIENYDYDNKNDRENFCPAMCDDDDDDVDPGDDNGFNITSGGDFSSHNNTTGNSISDLNGTLNGTLLAGGNLVAQPNKVAKIEIEYAKTAKKMDVKKLKSAIWYILTKRKKETLDNEDKENQIKAATDDTTDVIKPDSVNGVHSFQRLLVTLPEKISKHAAKNLSVPIAFVCLLHLANEKTLKISVKDMEDLVIEQDS